MVVLKQYVDNFHKHLLFSNKENLGYTRANNLALRQANGNVLLLLNPDTLVFPDTFTKYYDAFQKKPEVGMISPQILNEDGSIQPSVGKFASYWTEFYFQFFLYKFFPSPYPLGKIIHPLQKKSYNNEHSVNWASGACLAIRKEVANQVGLLDEAIFMYGEDMEWCWKFRQAGYQVWYCPDIKIIHLLRQSSKRNYSTWIQRYTYGQLIFFSRTQPKFLSKLSGTFVIGGIDSQNTFLVGYWSLGTR